MTTPALHHSVFTGRTPFLPPNEQRQSTEGIAMINLRTKFKVFIYTCYEDMKGCENVENGVVW